MLENIQNNAKQLLGEKKMTITFLCFTNDFTDSFDCPYSRIMAQPNVNESSTDVVRHWPTLLNTNDTGIAWSL